MHKPSAEELKGWTLRSVSITAFASLLLATGCSTSVKTTAEKKSIAVAPDIDRQRATAVLDWLGQVSARARSMDASGSISLEQNGDAQSARFSVRSKRLATGSTTTRIDSLSMQVMGPFGIKVAKFLASPAHYYFYDALQGESDEGPTDAKSLERLTQLRGVSLGTMSDVLYGLAPNATALQPGDSVFLKTNGDHHSLVIHRFQSHTTELIALSGKIESGKSIELGDLSIRAFTRWNRDLDPLATSSPPDVVVRFGELTVYNGVPIPKSIEATAGTNKLTMEYSDVTINPALLTVYIKVPRK